MPRKGLSGIGILAGSHLRQSGIGNWGIMVSPVPLVKDYSGNAQQR
jgi:hypothetical protein